jgi:hypothetical protein
LPEGDAFVSGNVDGDHHVIGACIAEKAKFSFTALSRKDLAYNFGTVATQSVWTRQEALEASGLVEPPS